jgi:hypothetical protein
VKSIQVNYDGELGREGRKRDWDIAEWGERERMQARKENGMGGEIGQAWVDFGLWSKSTWVFLDIANSLINTHIFWGWQIV